MVRVSPKQDNIQASLDNFAGSGALHLVLIFFTSFESPLTISAVFSTCELVSVNQQRIYLHVHCTYCGIPFETWNTRRTHSRHELILRAGVAFELVDHFDSESSLPPFPFSHDSDEAAEQMRSTVNSELTATKHPFPWLAATAELCAAGLTAAKFQFGAQGVYIACHITTNVGSLQFAAGMFCVYGASTVLIAGGVGIAVAAAVYFIPWAKVARWITYAWKRFVAFLKSVWHLFEGLWHMFVRFMARLLKVLEN
jgi:hypothetical protein